MGWFIKVITDDNLWMLEFFNFFRIGIAWINDLSGKATSLIIGLWKFETNITLAIRKKLSWHEIGEA